jgi:hypothetical protein
MTKPKPLYGWFSHQHAQIYPDQVCIYLTPEGEEVLVTQVLPSDSDPGTYRWPDAGCLGPVTELVKSCKVRMIQPFYSWGSPAAPVSKVKRPPSNWLKQALIKFRKLTGSSQ